MVLTKPSILYSLRIDGEWCRILHNDQQRVCSNCHALGHSRRKCPEITCHVYGEKGHFSYDCTQDFEEPQEQLPEDNIDDNNNASDENGENNTTTTEEDFTKAHHKTLICQIPHQRPKRSLQGMTKPQTQKKLHQPQWNSLLLISFALEQNDNFLWTLTLTQTNHSHSTVKG